MISSEFLLLQLSGQDQRFLVEDYRWSCKVHKNIVEPLNQLSNTALKNGFEIGVASGFRDFMRQRQIWDEKTTGCRVVLDDFGNAVDLERMSDWEKVQAILRWSALPGLSRHHWGSEIDIFEKSAMNDNYQLQLNVEETESGGIFAEFYCWLDEQLGSGQDFDFFRPYYGHAGSSRGEGCKGVASEPWHLSHGPTAWPLQNQQTIDVARQIIAENDILLKDVVLAHFEEIYLHYISVDKNMYPLSSFSDSTSF